MKEKWGYDKCPLCGRLKYHTSELCSSCRKIQRSESFQNKTLGYFIDGKNYLSFYAHKAGNITSDQYLRVWDIYGANMNGFNQPENVELLCGNTNKDINTYIVESHKIFYQEVKNNNRGLDVTSIPHMPQFRMINSIVGEQTITNNSDVLPAVAR